MPFALWRRKPSLLRLEAAPAGFTLIELILVLGLIGLVAAWVAPHWRNQSARQRLESAAKDLRSLWQETRLKAIEQATPYEFDVVPRTGYYRVRRVETATASFETRAERRGGDEFLEVAQRGPTPQRLPDGIRIAPRVHEDVSALDPEEGPRGMTALEREDAKPGENDWVAWIRFDPQGTVTEARLLLDAPVIRQRLQLAVRGLTGGVTIDVVSYPDLPLD